MEIVNFKEKVLGAWLGKAVGGTLGQPWEGCRGPLALDYYDPVPTCMIPNDDLDLQVVWACHLAGDWNGVVSYKNFAAAWVENVGFPFDEYGVAIRNLKIGIPAPWSGKYDNAFTDGLGGAIRSEIWAVLAPGDPAKAAKMAEMDARVDHDGNGVYAEIFLAVIESLAFVESDIRVLIEKSLAWIPADCTLAASIRDTIAWCDAGKSFDEIFELAIKQYGNDNFTDVVMNFSFVIAALLLGKGDFAKSICLAVNFGQDADCTGATVGSILGIIDPGSIPENWLTPIGRNMVISKEIVGINAPDSLDAFTDLLIDLREKIVIDDTIAPEPDWSKFRITMEKSSFAPHFIGDYRKFSPAFNEEKKETITVPGNYFELDLSNNSLNELVMLKRSFSLEKETTLKVIVNTPCFSRVWIDGELAFEREGGVMVPAFHRTPANQAKIMTLSAGKHTLTIGVAKTCSYTATVPLLFGCGDLNAQGLPEVR